MDTAMPFQQAEDGLFPGGAPAPFSFTMPTEIALIDFDFTRELCLMSNLFCDDVVSYDISILYWLTYARPKTFHPCRRCPELAF
ncbi:hypothetical protein B0W47_00460 [Komagataeibacter nataicola]|uniref:Uncharacterized protein n=1 Tax=Komagataeibacter nataicola TaxID=265960 RepID=A0A9N7H0I9_9PROT|nr:hypothetical protein [Komagataeibacter nataicola]AQU86175.1 hypothetical protein B0W47_00460 [Komagataeibacter nataicola]WEQ56887.1 hypothetical protein LV564_07430 [Komagataeibacter nataicola]WNM08421.1 hypothetical protein RI056_16415 [Komagataeibacter nataicola]